MTRSLSADFTTEKDKLWSRPFVTAVFHFGGAVGDIYVGEFDHTIGANAHKGCVQSWGEYRDIVKPMDGAFPAASASVEIINHPVFGSPAKRFTDLWTGIGVEGAEADVYLNFWRGQNDILQQLMFAAVMRPEEGEYDPDRAGISLQSVAEKYLDKEFGYVINQTDTPNADIDDIGQTANEIYGSVKNVRAHAIVAAPSSVLRDAMTTGATTAPIHDEFHDILPTAGTVQVGNEKIAYTGKGGLAGSRTLTGLTRGSGGTPVESHAKNDALFQVITEFIYLAAAHELKSLSAVYIEREGKRIPLFASEYTVELANTTLVAGKTLALIKFTSPPVVALKDFVAVSDGIGVSDTIGISQPNNEGNWEQQGSDESLVFNEANLLTNQSVESAVSSFPAQNKTKSSGSFTKRLSHVLLSGSIPSQVEVYIKDGTNEIKIKSAGTTTFNGGSVQFVNATYWGMKLRYLNTGANTAITATWTLSGKTVSYLISTTVSKTGLASKTGAVTLSATSTAEKVIGDALLFDAEGYKDDVGGTYTGTAGAIIEKPADVMHHLARVPGAIPASRVDAASFLTARTDAPASYKFSGVITLRTTALREALLSFGMQSRTRPEWPTDKLSVRFLKSAYGAATKTIKRDNIKKAALRLRRGAVKDLINTVQVHYGRQWDKARQLDIYKRDSFRKVTTPATDSTSVARYGTREQKERFLFDFIAEANSLMADDIRDFYKNRYKEVARFAGLAGFLDNVELLPGDIVALDYLVGATEKFDGLDGTMKFLVEEVGFAPGILSREQGPKMRFVLREVS